MNKVFAATVAHGRALIESHELVCGSHSSFLCRRMYSSPPCVILLTADINASASRSFDSEKMCGSHRPYSTILILILILILLIIFNYYDNISIIYDVLLLISIHYLFMRILIETQIIYRPI